MPFRLNALPACCHQHQAWAGTTWGACGSGHACQEVWNMLFAGTNVRAPLSPCMLGGEGGPGPVGTAPCRSGPTSVLCDRWPVGTLQSSLHSRATGCLKVVRCLGGAPPSLDPWLHHGKLIVVMRADACRARVESNQSSYHLRQCRNQGGTGRVLVPMGGALS